VSQRQSTVDQLLSEIASTQARIRARAAKCLGESGDPRAVAPLIVALGDRVVAVRLNAAKALGALRGPSSVRPLVGALRDMNRGVRHAAAGALKKFGKAAYAPVLEAFKTGDAGLRLESLSVLARSRSAATSELLIAALDDREVQLRLEATRLLAQRKERKAVEPLIAALDQPDILHWLYVWALGEIGDPRAFEPLEVMLESQDFQVQSAAVTALRKIDNARAVDVLYQRLDDPCRNDYGGLARTLAGMDLMSAVRSVRKNAADGNPDVLRQALQKLGAALTEIPAFAQNQRLEDTAQDQGQASLERMRQLESELRNLGRKLRDG
jgi:HEAT repeat protein